MAISFRSVIYRNSVSKQRRQVTAGTSKILFEGTEAGTYVLQFKDQVSPLALPAYDLSGKGAIMNRLSELFMSRLNEMSIETHFIKRLNMSEQLIKSAEVIPLRLTVHNAAVDQLAQRLGLDEPYVFNRPIMELSLKSRELNYPIISEQHVDALQWARPDEVDDMMIIAQRANDFLSGQFYALGLRLLNFTLEFGRCYQGEAYEDTRLIVIDEISPDTCAILDLKSGERLDGLCPENHEKGSLETSYKEIARRFGILEEGGPIDLRDPIIIIEEIQLPVSTDEDTNEDANKTTDADEAGQENKMKIYIGSMLESAVLPFKSPKDSPLPTPTCETEKGK